MYICMYTCGLCICKYIHIYIYICTFGPSIVGNSHIVSLRGLLPMAKRDPTFDSRFTMEEEGRESFLGRGAGLNPELEMS